MESNAERRKRLTRVPFSNTIEQRMIAGGSNNERLSNVGTTSFVPTSVSLSLLPPRESLHSYDG